jgi:hypothetical protein
MSAVLITALALLAFPACVVRQPTKEARTIGQLAERVRAARWWELVLWPICVGLILPFALAPWWAARSAVFNVSAVLAWLLAKVATATSNDGRRYRLTRSEGMRALLV